MKYCFLLAAFLLSTSPVLATTCAFDGHMLAADSQRTRGNGKQMNAIKIHAFPNHHTYCACAGDCSKIERFLRWYKSDLLTPEEIKGEYEVMMVFEDGECRDYVGTNQEYTTVSAPFAIGSGEDFALAAMACGKTAAEAIAIAEQLDTYTGGQIHTVVLPTNKP